ncbi:MAG TPA: heparan-alpha-glucosaminide N-acetyltransferase domain-containing protein [Candidatus Acidoferrum sp.]|nr:heparan-alpha-glucosaminide N-acetyltransferase domain-containing protein [Candidatus Acidoferrum sp.]
MATVQSSQTAAAAVDVKGAFRTERIQSVDVFRGLTIALMILVNNNGDFRNTYWPFLHSEWNGWTPTDLVFPFFVFIVGVSMVYSFRSRLARGDSKSAILMHAFRRAVVLFAIGVFVVNSFPDHYNPAHIRIYGVLQRIAICYLVAAVFVLWTGIEGKIVAIGVCLIGYWILMRCVPVPGFGVPTHNIPLLDPDRNWVAWLDRKLLMGHLYEGTRDPEGLLSTIPAIGTILFGVLTGDWLRSKASSAKKALWMLIFGVIGLGAGKFFNIWFPINKKLWTSSYVLFTAGFALVVLALCYWLLDVRKLRGRWAMPVLVFGMNAIAAYTLSEMLAAGLDSWILNSRSPEISMQELIYHRLFAFSGVSTPNTSLAYALAFVLVCWLVMLILWRKKIFLKV